MIYFYVIDSPKNIMRFNILKTIYVRINSR